jgi:hypothetical protein
MIGGTEIRESKRKRLLRKVSSSQDGISWAGLEKIARLGPFGTSKEAVKGLAIGIHDP